MTLQEILLKIENAKALDFGNLFNNSVELFKKSWLYGFLFQLFILILMIPFFIIFYVPFIMAMIAQSESGQTDSEIYSEIFAGLTGLYLLIFIVGILAIAVIQLALQAGLFRIIKNIDHGQEVKASDLFHFLKSKYFGGVTMLMIATFVVALVAALLCFVPLIYAFIPMSYFIIIYTFNPEIPTTDIVKVGFKLGTKKWLLSFGLFIVLYLLIMVLSFITCGIGSIFLSPFIYLPFYLIYKEVVGFDLADNLEITE